ncbi:hypothetical protein K1I86_08040 [Streptococcus cristatus]|uniref:Uncharacterized protein n=1 Tax=Streptococcus cristatus TaxID=45634 RepID=A0A3R9KUP2_STRCR|nr:hypothetical protein [Streptococcus cristatus]MBZ2152645.1 hypothetical protein [Streptococcus cristatus]RSJ81337.1 hypothetical protein D8791_07505 [Streptococcus cristatus]
MATKEKWVELFEQVIGRKPTADEFLEGKRSDFDPKKIISIAAPAGQYNNGVSEEKQASLTQEEDSGQEEPALEFLKEEFVEDSPKEEKQEISESDQYQEQRENWLQAFETNIGRKPTKEEFLEARNQGFANLPIRSELLESEFPQKPIQKRRSKKKAVMIAFPLILLFVLLAAFLYLSSVTGVKVVTDDFAKAVTKKDYDGIADLLSSSSDKWTRADARTLVEHLESQEINIETELDNIAKSKGKSAYIDDNQNKLLGVTEKSKKFGIFQEYQIVAYPVEVKVNTNLDNASIKAGDKKSLPLSKNAETNIGKYHFIKQEFTLKGKTEVGEIESKIQLDLATAKNNEIKLDLKSEKKRLKVTMPAEASNATDLKIVVNGKEIGSSLETDIQVVPHQELEVYAKFVVADNTFVTNKESIVVKGDTLDVALSLPKEVTDKIKEKDEEAKKVEANKAKITNFLSEYRTAVFRSVSNRSNYYAQYYDTSSPSYKEMVEWTTGGGVKKAKIDYYDPGALDIREVREENGSYIVTTYEDYTVHYIDSTPNSVNRKNKTYYLKPTGNSFAIYNIEVSES